jgi:hypothetical protein
MIEMLQIRPPTEDITVNLYLAKFVCGLALHLLLQENQVQGLLMMKHAVNHSYKFENYGLVSALCLSSSLIAYACEILNFVVLISVPTVMDAINSFVALYIIAELDKVYFKVMMSTAVEHLDEETIEVLTIRHCTSSVDARLRIKEN